MAWFGGGGGGNLQDKKKVKENAEVPLTEGARNACLCKVCNHEAACRLQDPRRKCV